MPLVLGLDLSRSPRPSASALTLGAVGKNCAKPGADGGRVIVVDGLLLSVPPRSNHDILALGQAAFGF
jgi:hypothetical protein